MNKFYLFSVLIFFAFCRISNATHIVGGEMNYLYLGSNQYRITMLVYRDCYNGQADFDDPASIGIYNGSGSLTSTTYVGISSQGYVPNAINSPCLDPPTYVCYEFARYVFIVTLPAGGGAYTIAYQRCCRNYSILNIDNVQNTGATYMTEVTDPLIAPVNSNPIFNDLPPTFICKDAPFTFDHAATDPDGDSIVYELGYPYEGGDQVNRAPDPPSAPPYVPVTFQLPYAFNNPMGGLPLEINVSTGILKATPNSLGQFVYCIVAKEYRNGIYLGETRRDFQVNVVSCPEITVASILSPTIACGSLDANFVNNSYHAASYRWEFGDVTMSNDTSNLLNPTYTYPDTGDYVATLIAYSPENSLCNDTVTGIVHVYPLFLSQFYISNNHCSPRFSFFDQSYGINGSSNFWHWDFGDNTFSNDSAPVHDYNLPGEYKVTLMSSVDSACLDTLTKTVHVLQNPLADFSVSLDTCTYSITTTNNSLFAAASRWDFGDYIGDFSKQGLHRYSNHGNYRVQLIVSTDSICEDTSVVNISIPPLPYADFDYRVTTCDSVVSFVNQSANASTYHWDFGDGHFSKDTSPVHTYSVSGYVPVEFSAFSQHGCESKAKEDIFFISTKEAGFEAMLDSCSGFYNFFNVTNGAAFYYWDFGDGSISTAKQGAHKYIKDGDYNVSLVLNAESPCETSTQRRLTYESPLGEKVYIPNTFTPNGDGLNDIFSMSAFRPCDLYKLTIFNRWGQKVFHTEDASSFIWDGTFGGEKLPMDVYVYLLENSGNYRQGTITILR